MPEQLAYDITRVLFEKQPELAQIHPEARNLSLATAQKGSPVAFHPVRSATSASGSPTRTRGSPLSYVDTLQLIGRVSPSLRRPFAAATSRHLHSARHFDDDGVEHLANPVVVDTSAAQSSRGVFGWLAAVGWSPPRFRIEREGAGRFLAGRRPPPDLDALPR